MVARIVEHGAPTGEGRKDAESEEARVPRASTGQWLCVTSEDFPRQRLAPVASACASNPMPRTEGPQARRSVRKR
jgi:hypothetical protein